MFAVYFSASPAMLSTPHLYISALSTWPRDSEPLGRWRSYFRGIPAFKNAARGSPLSLVKINVGSDVYSVAFSTDGTCIVSGSLDNSVQVWDASTGKELNVLNGHTDSVYSVAFSTDGTCIVSGLGDKSVWVWDTLTGKVLNVLNGHTKPVYSVAFSTDGRCIVSGSGDKSVRVWDIMMQPHYIQEQTKTWSSYYSPKYTGWLLSADRQAYLMFVPLDALLSDSFNILTIPHSAASSVDFTNATIGSQWHSCYSP